MKKLIYFTLTLFLLAACSNEDNPTSSPEETDTYELSSIQYYIGDSNDGVQITETKYPDQITENQGSDILQKTTNDYEGVNETSCFMSNEVFPYKLSPKTYLVTVPTNLTETPTSCIGNSKWTFDPSNHDTESLPTVRKQSSTTEIPPLHRLVYQKTIKFTELKATYIATFIGKKTGHSVEIKGKWKGVFVHSMSTKEILQ